MKKETSFPIATALKRSLKGYSLTTFRNDCVAAFVVSLVALPLSMALAIAVGLPPQHGIYTAIVAGVIVPLLGGSLWQVSGPTAAFVVILAPIVSHFGLRGIIWAGLLAGMILMLMGLTKVGRLIHYVPYPVTTGFTSGIAFVLAILSLNDFLGLGIENFHGEFLEKLMQIMGHLSAIQPMTFAIGATTLILLFGIGQVMRFPPSALIALPVATLLGMLLTHYGYDIATIGSKFSYQTSSGETISGIPPYPPVMHLPTFSQDSLFSIPIITEFRQLLFPAIAIAILAAIESLLSATVADNMTGTKHDPNAELNAIGIGNILSALATGIPATGAIARTATAINNGANTPIASSMHALFIMLYVILLAPIISYLPMSSLAALLIYTAYRMSHLKQFIRTIKIAPGSDTVVLLTCFLLTVFIDMVAGVVVGMVCAAFLLINRFTDLTKIELDTNSLNPSPEAADLPDGTMLYRIRGPLFFGTIEKVFDRYQFAHDFLNCLILDIRQVPFIDMTGLVALKSILISIAHEGRHVHIICEDQVIRKNIQAKIADHKVRAYIHFAADLSAFHEQNNTKATEAANT